MLKESFVAETIDGWKLEIFRSRIHLNSLPILVWHGLSTCSEIFQSHSKSNSEGLQEFLTRKGFDVFVGNSRGNKFTRQEGLAMPGMLPAEHQSNDWDFSLDEGYTVTHRKGIRCSSCC
jgi:hypothetical protein